MSQVAGGSKDITSPNSDTLRILVDLMDLRILGSWDLGILGSGPPKDITSPNTDTHIHFGDLRSQDLGYMDPIWGLFGSPPEGSTAWSPITSNGGSLDAQYPLNHGLKPPILGSFWVILGSFRGLDLDLQKISRHQTPTRISILGTSDLRI